MAYHFSHDGYIAEAVKELQLTPQEIESIKHKYYPYLSNFYAIPITIWMPPTPYTPVRWDPRTMRFFVPKKTKLVTHIRELILKEIGAQAFAIGFFPRYSEITLRTNYYIPIPQAFNKESCYLAEIKALRPIVTPDLDNVDKIINDAIKSFLIYDDAQIVTSVSAKYYSRKPRIEVLIIYNSLDNAFPVHEKLIIKRKHAWQKKLASANPPAVVQLLRKFFHT
jgi:Holliday junction resolvase RusA-like endonuclease